MVRRLLVQLPGKKLFGQETAIKNLAVMLREEGYEIEFLLHAEWGKSDLRPILDQIGFISHLIPMGTIWGYRSILNPKNFIKNIISIYSSSKKLKEILSASKYDAIILCNLSFSIYILPAIWRREIGVIFRYGDDIVKDNLIYRGINLLVLPRVNVHVANCAYLAQCIKQSFPKLSVRVIHNYPLEVARRQLSAVLEEPLPLLRPLVYVGQLAQHKGLNILLDAFDLLAARYANLSLSVAGALPGVIERHSAMLDRIARSQSEWGDRVHFLGYIVNVSPVFSRGAIHALPSIWEEPSPNVVFEAKARGVPSVAFPRGGVPELIEHQIDGYLCTSQDAAGLAQGIEYFLEDESRYREASDEAQRSLSMKFSYDLYREKWLNAVADALPPSTMKSGQ